MYQNKPKGGKNMRGGNSSVGRGGHRGGGYGQQGRNNSMNGNQYGPQLSNKGTFDAAGSNSSSHTNLSEIDGIYKNSQLLHLVTSMIGSLINVQTLDGKVYEGILKAFSPEFDMALVSVVEVLPKTTKNENTLSSEYKSKNFINDVDNILESLKNNKPPANTMIIKLDDSVKVVLANADLDFASSKKMVLTDSEISKTDSNKPQAQIERELVPWNDGDGDHLDTLDTGNNPAGNTGWNANDMLEYNEKKYKISSTFDDSLTGYTIPLEKRDDEEFRASMEKAEAIAREIEGDGDRSRRLALENELDEETRFSAVLSGGKRDHELGPKDSRDDRRDMKNNNQRNDRHNNSNNNGNNSNNARNPRGQGAPRAEMNWRDESRMRDQNRYYQPQHGNNYANYPQKGGNDSRSGSGNYGNQPKYQNSGNNHHQPQQQQQQQQLPQQQQAPQQQQQQPQQQQPYPPPSNAQSQPPPSSQPPVKSYAGAALSSKPPTNQQPASEHQQGMNTQAPPPTAYNDQYDQRGGPRGGPGPKRTPPPSNYNDNENRRPPHRHDSFNKHNNNTNNNQQRSDVPTPVLRPREPSDYPLRKSNTPPNSSKAPNEDRKTPPNERPQQQQPKPAQQPPTLQTMEAHAEEQKAKESKNDVKKEKSPVKNEPEVKGADVTAVPVSAPAEKPNEQNEKPGDASMSSAGDNAGNSSSTLSKLNPNAKSFTPRGLNVGVQHQQVLQPQVQMQQQVPVSYPQYSNQMPPTSPHPQQFIQIPQIQMAQRPLTHMPPYGNPYQNPALLGPAQYAIPAMQHNSLLHVYQPTVAQQMGGGPPPPNVMPGQHVQGPPHMNQQGQAPQQGQGQRFRGKGPQGQGQPQYLPRGAPQNPQGPPPQHVDYQANVHAVNAVTGPPIQMAGPQAYQQPAPGQVVQQQVSHHHPQQMPGVPMPGPPQQFFYGPPRYNLPMQAHHPGAMNMQPQIAYDPSQMSMMLPAMNCDPAAMFNNAAMAAAAAGNAQMAQVQMAQAQQQSQGVPNNGQGHPGQQQHGVPQPGQVPPPQIQAGNPSQGPPPQAY